LVLETSFHTYKRKERSESVNSTSLANLWKGQRAKADPVSAFQKMHSGESEMYLDIKTMRVRRDSRRWWVGSQRLE
jgi:hypothetical protein